MAELEKIYEWADDALKRGNYAQAIELYNQIITTNPNEGTARKGLRSAIIKKFQVEGAPSKLKLYALGAKTMGQLAIYKNNPQKRMEIAQSYLNNDPNDVKARVALGESLKDVGHLDGAIAELSIATEIQKDNTQAMKLLGIAYKEKGMLKEAEEWLTKVLQYNPDDRDAGKILRDVAATTSLKEGFEDAKSYRDVLKDKDQSEELEKRQHLIKTDEDIQDELERLQQELQQNPKDVKTIKSIADMYFEKKKDYTTARDWYKKAVELNPTDSAMKNKVDDCTIRLFDEQIQKLEAAKDTKSAEVKKNKLAFEMQSFEHRVIDTPTDVGLRFELGKRYYAAGQVDKAVAEFQQAVKDPKRKVDSHIYLGICFKHKEMFDLAINQLEKALTVGFVSNDKQLLIRYNMAICYADEGKLANAIEEGKKIMEVDISYKDISKLVSEWSKKVKTQ